MKLIPTAVSSKIGRQLLIVQKNSPHLMFAAGVVGIVGTVVLASRATLKLAEDIDEMHEDVQAVKTDLKHRKGQYQKDLAYAYSFNAVKVAKLYAPSVVLGTVSIGLLTGSHVQMTRRNTALTAAYATLSTAYDNYRERVRSEVGEEKEADLYSGGLFQKITIDGKKEEAHLLDPNRLSPYARIFDETSIQYVKNAEINKLFIRAQQNYLNDLLHARGHVFLNEAYDALGLERSSAGQIVGWVLDEGGDNYVDFGLYRPESARFVNGLERAIVLDFNVDGPIFDKI